MKTINKYTKQLLVFSLVAVIFISGCTGGGGSTPGSLYGADSLRISIDTEGKTTFDALEDFVIAIEVQNVGDFDVTNVQARLHGYGGITSSEDEVLSDMKELSPNTVEKPDSEGGLAGGTADVSWDVSAPYLSGDAPDSEITMTGEVIYDTKSLATQRIVVATKEYVDSAEARGDRVPVSPTTDILNGPVSLDVDVRDEYIKLVGTEEDFSVRITLDNDGTGSIYNTELLEYDYLNKVTLRVPVGLEVDENNCDFVLESGSGLNAQKVLVIDENNNRQKLRMGEGGVHRDLTCKLMAHRDYVGGDGYNTFDLTVTAEYTYLQGVTKKLIIEGGEASPLKVRVLEPTRNKHDIWTGEAGQHALVEVLYQNEPVTTGLTADDFKVWLEGTLMGNTGTGVPTALDYEVTLPSYIDLETVEKVWDLELYVPKMGCTYDYDETTDALDVSVEVTYNGYTERTTQSNGVEYDHPEVC